MVFEVFQEDVIAFFALGAADDFADAGDEEVHGGDGFFVVVEAHVEGFDFSGVVVDGGGLVEVFFGEPAFVLGLEVEAVLDGVLELFPGGGEEGYGIGVGDALEGFCDDGFEAGAEGFIDKFLEDGEVWVGEGGGDEVADEFFGAVHVCGEVAEGHFGLDHPELGGVAGGVGVLGAEGGAEGVDVREGGGEGLAFELAGDGEVGAFPEEVGGGVGDFLVWEGGDAEHFTSAFAIAGGDDGGVEVRKRCVWWRGPVCDNAQRARYCMAPRNAS